MNTATLLNKAGKAIEDAQRNGYTRAVMFIRKSVIYCRPAKDVPADAIHVCGLNRLDIIEGLDNRKWTEIGKKLEILQRRGVIEWAHQKH